MSEAELLFTALAELSTRQIAESTQAKGIGQNAKAGQKGGAIAKNARKALEAKTGKSVVTGENFLPPKKASKIRKMGTGDWGLETEWRLTDVLILFLFLILFLEFLEWER